VHTQGLERLLDPELRAVQGDPGLGEGDRHVARAHRAVEARGVARLAEDHDALAVDLRGQGLRLLLGLQVVGLELHAAALEVLERRLDRAQRLALAG
jgi:hypothetical protein